MGIASFAHLKQLKVADRTYKLTLPYDLGTLELRHAGRGNPAWMNRQLKTAQSAGGKSPTAVVDATTLEQSDLDDVDQFVELNLVGWEGVVDEDGRVVPFNATVAGAWLRVLITYAPDVWRRIVGAAANVDNFRDGKLTTGADLGKP